MSGIQRTHSTFWIRGKEPNAFIFPTIFITVQFHTILRIPNTREQKPPQGCNHAALIEVEAASLLVKENVSVWVRRMVGRENR